MTDEKQQVFEFWNQASCGEDLYLATTSKAGYAEHAKRRYELEPYIVDFAQFSETKGARVLEIGVGLGADHQRFAKAGAILSGIDLTERAITHARRRLLAFNLLSDLAVGDAENMTFENDYFDVVYSWGVLHHSPNTAKAISEVFRVLKPSGTAKIMVYSTFSMVGLMLWFRYALLRGRPFTSLSTIYSKYLESPGTKTYTLTEAGALMKEYTDVKLWTVMTHGDLLDSEAGQRHGGPLLTIARRVWPRWFIRKFLPRSGLFLLIEARKPL
ncbi:MAG: class I SAM-dependent methyltransferase [Phycisphaerales bacterium]|nr:class I SAM-dependent methyltransferase [Phycisphaerales bacterium]